MMRLFTLSYTLLFLFICEYTYSQELDLPALKSQYPDDNAVFSKLYLDVDISINDQQLLIESTRHEEITHLDDHSTIHAKDKIYTSSFDETSDIEAYTLIPHKRRYKKIEVKDFKETYDKTSSVFYDDTKVINFIYPAIAEGAKTVVSYTKKHQEPRFAPSYYFQSYLPIVDGRFSVTVDDGINTDLILHNDPEGNIEVRSEKLKNRTRYIYSIKDIKKLKYESSTPNIKYYVPHVNLLIRSYKTPDGTQDLLTTEKSLYNWYKTFTEGLNNYESPTLQAIVSELVEDAPTELDKVKRIYYWVQKNIKYIAFEDGMRGLIPHNGEYVCNKRYGDCKDMASILINMMHIANIKGYFTWVGTRDIPYSYSEVPSPIVDNHMIATYKHDSTFYYLDATSQFSPFGLPSSMIQGKEVLIGIGDQPEIRKVPVIDKTMNIMADSMFITLKDGVVKGSGKVTLSGYAKVFNSYSMDVKDEKGIKNYLTRLLAKGSNKFALKEYSLQNLDDLDSPIAIDYKFEVPDYYKQIGDEIYINANLDKSFANDFIDEDRVLPIENEYKYTNRIATILTIPKGYKVSYLPENTVHSTDIFGYSIEYGIQEDQILVTKAFYLDYLLLEKQNFQKWNTAIKKLSADLRESIILTNSEL